MIGMTLPLGGKQAISEFAPSWFGDVSLWLAGAVRSVMGLMRGRIPDQDGTRKARKNTAIPCESIGAAATNRRWGILEP